MKVSEKTEQHFGVILAPSSSKECNGKDNPGISNSTFGNRNPIECQIWPTNNNEHSITKQLTITTSNGGLLNSRQSNIDIHFHLIFGHISIHFIQ